MKRFLLNLVCLLAPLFALAQGWPANYGGVMLQGFYWDSYKETSWSQLTAQSDTLSKYFDLIWVPNSATTSSYYYNNNATTMGYDPCYWLKQDCSFGTESQLRTMINTFKKKGTGIIEDVVINHKNGISTWVDFPDETVTGKNTGKTYKLTWTPLKDICQNDEANYSDDSGVKGQITGAWDTGDNFDGYRDLDHTNTEVQDNVKVYLDFLKNELGYAGFRYDMVKGYGSYYTKIYNESSQPEFSVGEYWDSSYDAVYGWCRGTGDTYRSAAFDFPLKFGAIANGFNAGNFTSSGNAFANKGMAGDNVGGANRYSVTFVDNHDTYRDNGTVTNNVLAANAFILALPGTPCIFWPHWTNSSMQPELKKMILARKTVGITNQSYVIDEGYGSGGNGYWMRVRGNKGEVLSISGYATGLDELIKGYTLISAGTSENPNYAYYIKMDQELDDTFTGTHIYVQADDSKGAPYIYAWNSNDVKINGDYPGRQMRKVTINGSQYYSFTTTASKPISIILSYGGDDTKTGDITNISEDKYYWFENKNVTDLSIAKYVPTVNTAFCLLTSNDVNVTPSAWVWNSDKNFTGGTWPGAEMAQVGTIYNYKATGKNYKLYKWSDDGKVIGEPTNVIFSYNNGGTQTADLNFLDGKICDWGANAGGNPTVQFGGMPILGEEAANREFTAGKRSTFVLPFSLTEDEVASLPGTVYEMTSYDSDGNVHFGKVNNVKAFHPYVFTADSNCKPFERFANWVWVPGKAEDVDLGGLHFVAHMSNCVNLKSNSSRTYYAYSNDKFIQFGSTSGANVQGYRCYFYQDGNSTAKPMRAVFSDGSATGIDNVVSTQKHVDNAWYNLQGQRVNAPSHGIFIKNGKKYVIK